jgi:hypothetical protein
MKRLLTVSRQTEAPWPDDQVRVIMRL